MHNERGKFGEHFDIISTHYNDFGDRAFTSVMYGLLSKPAPVPNYTVTFKDRNGITLKEVNVNQGETVAEIAKELNPERFGYVFIGWNNDVETPIVEDKTFTAIYKRDVETKYEVKINDQTVEQVAFDTRITVDASEEVLWMVNNQKFHIGKTAVMYAFGNMHIEAHELDDIDKDAPFISLLGTITTDTSFVAFVHVYSGAGEIEEYGATFWNVDTPTSRKNIVVTEGCDAMISLVNIKAGAYRGVKAYAIVDGTALASDYELTHQF